MTNVPTMRATPRVLISALTLVGLVTASCGDDDDGATTVAAVTTAATWSAATSRDVSGDITVFAAASLTAAFTEIGDAFMTANPDATVTFNFAASSELVAQINEGAPADVFASADQTT